MKRLLSLLIVCTLVISSMTFSFSYATSEQDKLGQVNDRINTTLQKLKEGKNKEKSLSYQISTLNKKIKTQEIEIATIQGNMNQTNTKMIAAKLALDETKKNMEKQNESLNKRLRAMYKNGDIGLVEILLGSENISDFMTNMDMVQKIFDNDVDVLKFIKDKYAQIDAQAKALKALQDQLAAQKQSEAEQRSALEGNKGQIASLKSVVSKQNRELERQIDELNRQADELVAKIRALQGDEAYAGGIFAWPAPGYFTVTSPFGMRLHPILKVQKMHTGIDLRVPSKSKVVAANAGKVIMSGWYGGYGNVIMIDHGGEIVTLYGHNSSLVVKNGSYVKKGQLIAYSGSTGNSTGPHVHFEVRVNGKYVNPMAWLK